MNGMFGYQQPPIIVLQQPDNKNPLPMPPNAANMSKTELKHIKKALKFYNELMDTKNKKEGEKKKENIFTKPQLFILYTIASPLIGLAFIAYIELLKAGLKNLLQ